MDLFIYAFIYASGFHLYIYLCMHVLFIYAFMPFFFTKFWLEAAC